MTRSYTSQRAWGKLGASMALARRFAVSKLATSRRGLSLATHVAALATLGHPWRAKLSPIRFALLSPLPDGT